MKRILIIRLTAMGDVAMTSPVISAACRAYPDIEFDVLSEPFFEPFFEQRNNLHFIGTNIRKNDEGIRGLWKLYRQLSKNNYDALLDLHDVLRTKVIRTFFKRLSGVKTFVIDKGRSEKDNLITDNGKPKKQLKPTVERYKDVFLSAGLPIDVHGPYMSRLHSPFIDDNDKGNAFWVGISPFAQHQGKIYPLDKMKEVARKLTDKGAEVFIFGGGPKEKAVAEDWEKEIPHCHSTIGKGKLKDEMGLMSNLNCMISMDSSAMHICSLFGVRVVSVWGATHHFAGFLGYEQNIDDVIGLDLPCRPCSIYGNKPCKFGDYRCFNINPQTIVDKVYKNF